MAEKIERNTAYKLRIGDILIGKPVSDNERFSFLELGGKRIVRVNVIGNIVDKFESEGDKNYIFTTIDDGSGQISVKAFGDDINKIKDKTQGQTILVIGVLRQFNNEVYISPEIIRETDPRYLLVRKLETEGERRENLSSQDVGSTSGEQQGNQNSIKDRILETIKNSEQDGGVYTDQIIMQNKDASPEIINQEIKKLLEEGIIFEPRPGKVRWLG